MSVLSDVEANARLECDGSWTASADPVDRRIIAEAFFGWGRLVSHEAEVGGHPKPAEGVPCQDIDSDGMPDQWELLHGLDPIIPSDSGQDPDGDGYTSIEEYVNGTDPRSSLSLSAAVPFMRH